MSTYSYYDSPWEYDPHSGLALSYRLKEIDSPILRMSFAYDAVGNVAQKNDLDYFAESYSYDEMNRLISATSDLPNYGTRSYSYDAIDNILTKEGETYYYEGPHPHAVTRRERRNYTYDDNGNMIATDWRTMSWDAENRLVVLTEGQASTYYFYDATTNRVKKVEGTLSTYSFFPGYEEEYTEGVPEAVVVKYYFADGRRVAQRRGDTGLGYFHSDHLGSSVRMSDASGAPITMIAYLPYGAEAMSSTQGVPAEKVLSNPIVGQVGTESARQELVLETSVTASSDLTLASGRTIIFRAGTRVELGSRLVARIDASPLEDPEVKVKHKFTGQEQDTSGLYYYGARYYDAELARFISPDTVLDGLNRYAYCRNNPVRYADPTGHKTGDQADDMTVNTTTGQVHDFSDNDSGNNDDDGGEDSTPETLPPEALPVPVNFPIPFPRTIPWAMPDLAPPTFIDPMLAPFWDPSVNPLNDPGINMKDPKTWPTPPADGPFKEGEPSRKKPKDRGEKSLYDPEGGEWRPQKPDMFHPEGHWDYKPPASPKDRFPEWRDIYPGLACPVPRA